jgi:signal transduction histidine kinase
LETSIILLLVAGWTAVGWERATCGRGGRAGRESYHSDGFSGVSKKADALRRIMDRVLEATGAEDLSRALTRDLPAALGTTGATLLLWNRRLDSFESLTGGETQAGPAKPEGNAVAAPTAGFLLSDGVVIETHSGGEGVLVPLLARTGLVGMLVLGAPRGRKRRRKHPLARSEARRLSVLAARAALVLENHVYLKELVATERMAALGTMAGMLAHDFRTPMTVIRGYAELIRAEAESPAMKNRAQLVIEMVDRLDRMTRETMDFARSGGALARRAVDLRELLEEIARDLGRELPGLAVEARIDVPPGAAATLDTDKLRRAVFNIAANARDAMKGAGRLHLEAVLEEAPGRAPWLRLLLADEGPGVPAAIRDTLFEPFVTEGKKGGTGLGLAVTRRFVEEQGGTVELLDAPPRGGAGAAFRIRLPLSA